VIGIFVVLGEMLVEVGSALLGGMSLDAESVANRKNLRAR
jgi:hypothetical protein